MNKKDVKLIVGCLIVAAIMLGGYFIMSSMHQGDVGIVEYKEEILIEFELSENYTYEFEGTYGVMHLEVQDGSFRVVDVECPNHNCEQMGWHDRDSLSPIVCMPNEIVIYTKNQ